MATDLGKLAQETVSKQTGQSFDQGINQVIASDVGLRDTIGSGTTFDKMSEDTRQLVAESAATQLGDKSLLDTTAAQRFIRGDFSGSGDTYNANNTGSGAGSGNTGDGTGGSGTDYGTVSGEVVDGGQSNDLIDLINSRFDALNGGGTGYLTEDEILQQEQDNIQQQLDAINQLYNDRVNAAQVEGQGRLGRTRALNATSGTLFDPFGDARTAETEKYNRQIIDEINAERAVEIQNLYAAARGEATRRYESQEDRLIETANLFVDSMIDAYGLSIDEANDLRNNALSIAQLTGYYGDDRTLSGQAQDLSLRKYLTDTALAYEDSYRADRELAIAEEQLRQAGFQPQVFDNTLGYWDYSGAQPQWIPVARVEEITSSGSGTGTGSSTTEYAAGSPTDINSLAYDPSDPANFELGRIGYFPYPEDNDLRALLGLPPITETQVVSSGSSSGGSGSSDAEAFLDSYYSNF